MIGYLAAIWGCAFVATLLLTRGVLRYAVAQALLDLPNERSSHSRPTPRGGGLAIVLVVLGGFAMLAAAGVIDQATGVALVGGGSLVAAVGWMDDRKGVSTRLRLTFHLHDVLGTLDNRRLQHGSGASDRDVRRVCDSGVDGRFGYRVSSRTRRETRRAC